MKRNVAEIVRRGFDITVANWPLMLIRIAEHIVVTILAIGAVVAIVIPIAVSAGLGRFQLDPENANGAAGMIAQAIIDHWALVLFILFVITIVGLIFVAIHSFVQAGSADVYIANQFNIERWLAGGKRGWRPVFWIYNIAWLFAGVVLLIPILPIPFIIAMTGESMGTIILAVVMLAIWGFFAIFVAMATVLWSMKAIVLTMRRNLQAREALTVARREIRADFGRNFAVAFIMMVIWLGGTALIGTFSGVASIGHATPFAIITAPVHILLSLLNAIFSAGVESWFLASFISMES